MSTDGNHSREAVAVQRDDVDVLGMEFVDETARDGCRMLRDFFGKGLMVQPMNLVEFPVFGRDLHAQRRFLAHVSDSGSLVVHYRSPNAASSSGSSACIGPIAGSSGVSP